MKKFALLAMLIGLLVACVAYAISVPVYNVQRPAQNSFTFGFTSGGVPKQLLMDSNGNAQVAAGAAENHVGEVGSAATIVTVTPTITASSAYAAGNDVGGILTFTNALRGASGTSDTGVLQSLKVVDKDNTKTPFDILVFDASPGSGTYSDKTAISGLSGDLTHLVRKISVLASDYSTINSIAVADISPGARVLVGSASRNLYVVVNLTSGTPIWTSTSGLSFSLGVVEN